MGFQPILPGFGRTGGGLGAADDEAGFSKAAIRSRREPGLGFVGGVSDMRNAEVKECVK